ncbi:MAG: hypothetical protein PSX71_03920 [bacterium]|nr:hypothetical protein [bacterium]
MPNAFQGFIELNAMNERYLITSEASDLFEIAPRKADIPAPWQQKAREGTQIREQRGYKRDAARQRFFWNCR